MRSVAIVGAVDPRHRLFLEPVRRRRAGVRLVGLCEPDDVARAAAAEATGLPTYDDLTSLLADTTPNLLAVSGGDTAAIVTGLRAGLDVVATAPLADDPDTLAGLADAVTAGPGRLRVVHPWRGHAAAKLIRELVAGGSLGTLTAALLAVGHGTSGRERRRALTDGMDLVALLTPVGSDPSALPLEVVDLTEAEGSATLVEIAGTSGAARWNLTTGGVDSAIGDRPAVHVACGPPTAEAAWTLSAVIRADQPDAPEGLAALWSTRTALRITPPD